MNCTFTSCWIIWPRLNVYGSYLIDVKVHQTEHLQTIKSSEWNVYIYIYIYTVFKLNVTVICAIPISSINALDWLLFLLEDRVPFSLRDLDRWLIDFHHWLELGSHIADQFEINLKAMGFYFRYHSASRSAPFASQLNPSFSDLSCLRTVWMLSILSRSACKSVSSWWVCASSVRGGCRWTKINKAGFP